MGKQLALKSSLWTALNTESSIVGDGLTAFDYISTHSGVEGLRIVNDRSSLIEGACVASKDQTKASRTFFEMPFDKWVLLVEWALTNPSLSAAKAVLLFSLPIGMLKESAVSPFIDTTAGALKAVPFGFRIMPNFSASITESLYNTTLVTSGANTFTFKTGTAMNGVEAGLRIYNKDYTINASGTGSVSAGVASVSITTSSFTSGFIIPYTGVVFAAASYSSLLNADVTLAHLFNIYTDGAYLIGA